MPINLSNETRFDTRGLPVGYDPHKIYEYRQETLIKNSTGLESFLYKLMPISLVKSLAFAIDPTYQYKVSASRITPANRSRIRLNANVLQQGGSKRYRRVRSATQQANYKLVSFCSSPYYITTNSYDLIGGTTFQQDALPDRIKDTTRRTRLYGSDQGTLEIFKGYCHSPQRTVRRNLAFNEIYTSTFTNEPACSMVGGTYQKRRWGVEEYINVFSHGATLSSSSHNQLRTNEINYAKALCQKNAIGMLKSVEPMSGDYTLFRNLVELRDIPRSVRQLQRTATDLRKVYLSLSNSPKLRKVIFNLKGLSKDVPNEYLSYHFGWKQLWRDVNDLLALPEKTSKKVNFLMARSGKPTTLRSKRIVPSVTVAGVSGFDYRQTSEDYDLIASHRIERESEVRLVVNRIWDFPPINSVEYKRHVFAQRTGIEPRVTDIYNLIPWTWLLDWFTGLGNYIDLIETINSRNSGVVNWGMISCVTRGKLITEFHSKSTMSDSQTVDGVGSTKQYISMNRHTSVFNFECHTRDDVSGILGLNLTSVPSTLTTYQKSILGSLLLQRTKY